MITDLNTLDRIIKETLMPKDTTAVDRIRRLTSLARGYADVSDYTRGRALGLQQALDILDANPPEPAAPANLEQLRRSVIKIQDYWANLDPRTDWGQTTRSSRLAAYDWVLEQIDKLDAPPASDDSALRDESGRLRDRLNTADRKIEDLRTQLAAETEAKNYWCGEAKALVGQTPGDGRPYSRAARGDADKDREITRMRRELSKTANVLRTRTYSISDTLNAPKNR